GKPDQEFGEAVAAFVVLDEGARLSEDDIKEYCSKKIENHKIPAIINYIREIPRTPTGKILKKDLRELLF
ncbi:MAG: hypothetical protein JRF41_11125, partial [Deltaproteobacteria bacterium]|nr:hypothetical protein [Deltaproteobacteria bacterium]